MLTLRPVAPHDLEALLALAAQLDSVNLPADREFLAERNPFQQPADMDNFMEGLRKAGLE